MEFACQHCGNQFVSKYNLKRHLERKHDSWSHTHPKNGEESENEVQNSESDEESEVNQSLDESEDTNSETESEDSESESEDSETEDVFTYDEVQAIVRYSFQEKE